MEQHHVFTVLFEQYRLPVYRQAFRITRSPWHAEEIVQEVFMRVWIYRHKLAAVRDLRSWLFIITKHVAFNSRMKLLNERKKLPAFMHNTVADNTDILLPLKCHQLLAEAERQLTPRQKQIYYMAQTARLSKKEIARRLNLSEFTIIHYVKKTTSIIKTHILMRLEAGERRA